jgi:hypothetical protein
MEVADRLVRKWNIPTFSPHASSYWAVKEKIWDQDNDYLPILKYDLTMLDHCVAMLLVEGWEDSRGVQVEIAYANKNGIRVFESELALVDYIKDTFDDDDLDKEEVIREFIDVEED